MSYCRISPAEFFNNYGQEQFQAHQTADTTTITKIPATTTKPPPTTTVEPQTAEITTAVPVNNYGQEEFQAHQTADTTTTTNVPATTTEPPTTTTVAPETTETTTAFPYNSGASPANSRAASATVNRDGSRCVQKVMQVRINL